MKGAAEFFLDYLVPAVAEPLLQSNDGEVSLLPALPDGWKTGQVSALRARQALDITSNGTKVQVKRPEPGLVEFETTPGTTYVLVRSR